MLILGRDLVAFLNARRTKNKRTCLPGELYCVRCRAPRTPAGDMVDYVALTAKTGNLVAICSICETLIYRRVGLAMLAHVCAGLDVTMPQAQEHIGESAAPSLNSALERIAFRSRKTGS
jgi:hypothetical protein